MFRMVAVTIILFKNTRRADSSLYILDLNIVMTSFTGLHAFTFAPQKAL